MLAYPASYTHRIAISNRRLVSYDGENVTFQWRDYRDGYAQKTTTLTAAEFLRRFATHIVPNRFVRVRYFGFMANRLRRKSIEQIRELLRSRAPVAEGASSAPARSCPQCHTGTMVLILFVERSGYRTWFDSS